MSVTIQHLNKYYQAYHALNDINLTLKTGELTALLGPSGCGKTTLLRTIAGLEFADEGKIFFTDIDVTNLNPMERNVGFVFQNYALFQHMNIFENVAFGLKSLPRKQRPTTSEIKNEVMRLLELVQLPHLAKSYPAQLSGGQRQRVALARSLAVKPQILLLDEPFSALDAQVRKSLRRWLRGLQQELAITTIFVTHDQEEALDISDNVVVMNQGIVEQVDTPHNIYYQPKSEFVSSFLGDSNIFHAQLENNALIIDNFSHRLSHKSLLQTNESHNNNSANAYVRPYELTLSKSSDNALGKGKIVHTHTIGFLIRIEIQSEQSPQLIEVVMTKALFEQQNFKLNDEVYMIPDKINLFQNMNM